MVKERNKHRPSKLTGLYKQKEKLQKRQEILRETVKKGQLELGKLNKRLKAIENELNSINTRETIICEHAYLRFKERIKNIPNEEIDKIILTPQLETMIITLGNGIYPGEGFRCTVIDNKIVTILEP